MPINANDLIARGLQVVLAATSLYVCTLSVSYAQGMHGQEVHGQDRQAVQHSHQRAMPVVQQAQSVRMPLQVGEATESILAHQAQGTWASTRSYPLPVPVAERIYTRYLNSFTHPIAEKAGSVLESNKK